MSEPIIGQTWSRRKGNSYQHRPEYIIVAVANHVSRMDGAHAERLVIFRAAYGQRDDPQRYWAEPVDDFVRQFEYEPNPRTADEEKAAAR